MDTNIGRLKTQLFRHFCSFESARTAMKIRCRKPLLPHLMPKRGLPCWRPRSPGPMQHLPPATCSSRHCLVRLRGWTFASAGAWRRGLGDARHRDDAARRLSAADRLDRHCRPERRCWPCRGREGRGGTDRARLRDPYARTVVGLGGYFAASDMGFTAAPGGQTRTWAMPPRRTRLPCYAPR
jgi:hypothetical protein